MGSAHTRSSSSKVSVLTRTKSQICHNRASRSFEEELDLSEKQPEAAKEGVVAALEAGQLSGH